MSLDRSHIDVEHLLNALDLENVSDEGAEFRFSCPFPAHENGDRNPSAYMNAETTAFMCHSCHAKGDAVSFVARVLEISPMESTRLLREAYQPGYINPDLRNTEDEVKRILKPSPELAPNPILSETLIDRFAVDWVQAQEEGGFPPTDYMLGRGFTPFTLNAWDFGYDSISDRIVFPVRNHLGQLVGFKGRAYDKRKNKYLVIGDKPGEFFRYGFPTHLKNQFVFGLDKAIAANQETLIVCEGELNAIALWQMGYASVAINGSYFGERQAQLIREWANDVVLFFDSDAAGDDCTWGWTSTDGEYHPGVVDRLQGYMQVRRVSEHDSDPAELPVKQVENLIQTARGITHERVLRSLQASK